MELIARDFEPVVVEGVGEIRCPTSSRFEYTLTGTPEDPVYALAQLRRQKADRYDGLLRFRLIVEDAAGRSFNAGWTIPKVRQGDAPGDPWVFEGACEGFMSNDPSVPASPGGASDVEFVIPRRHRSFLFLSRFVSTDLPEGGAEPVHRLMVEGEQITFRFDAEQGVLAINAPGSAKLPLTFTENWLGEPLRILFGQLVFPRLVARSFPDGGAMISVRPAPPWSRESDWAALWDREDLTDKAGFWRLYSDLLTYVVRARDKKGGLNFEANRVTRLYEEVIQAAHGSRWVWALTFASSVEGLVRILTPRRTKRPDANTAGIAALVDHIGQWPATEPADKYLGQVAVNAVHRTAETTPKWFLDQMVARGVVTSDQVTAWSTIRNEVMHGTLVSPYSSAEDDTLLLHLAALMKALTREIVRGNPPAPA